LICCLLFVIFPRSDETRAKERKGKQGDPRKKGGGKGKGGKERGAIFPTERYFCSHFPASGKKAKRAAIGGGKKEKRKEGPGTVRALHFQTSDCAREEVMRWRE